MKLTFKIGLGFLLVVALMALLAGYQLSVVQRLHEESRGLSRLSFEAASLSLQLRSRLARLRELGGKLLVLRDPAYAAELVEVREAASRELTRLERLDLSTPERREVDRLAALWGSYAGLAPGWEEAVVSGRGEGADELRAFLDAGGDELRAQLDRVTRSSRGAISLRVRESGERVDRARRAAWGATLAALVAAVFGALFIVRSLVRPLRRLARGTREVAAGHFGYRVEPSGGPELESLAADFNAMAARLSELDQLKKDFLAGVSHDLKAPLASIRETGKLLLEGIPGPLGPEQEKLLRLQLRCGDRLSTMIEDLLGLARLEAGTVRYELEREDLVELARTSLAEVEPVAAEKGLRLAVELPSEEVAVDGDRTFLLKAFQNLLTNAVKYTPEGGEVGVVVRKIAASDLPAAVRRRSAGGKLWRRQGSDSVVVLEVWDSGPGVPDADKHRIFDRFYRVAGSEEAGTGLGLAIAREVVDHHGGALWVEDRGDGGSLFRLALPVAAQDPRGERRSAPRVAALSLLALSLPLLAGCSALRPAPSPELLERGDAFFEAGDYRSAMEAYGEYRQDRAEDGAATPGLDRALFRLGLLHALPASPLHAPERARELWRELIQRFPESPYRPLATYLLDLQGEVERLRQQLEAMKRIDLEGEG